MDHYSLASCTSDANVLHFPQSLSHRLLQPSCCTVYKSGALGQQTHGVLQQREKSSAVTVLLASTFGGVVQLLALSCW